MNNNRVALYGSQSVISLAIPSRRSCGHSRRQKLMWILFFIIAVSLIVTIVLIILKVKKTKIEDTSTTMITTDESTMGTAVTTEVLSTQIITKAAIKIAEKAQILSSVHNTIKMRWIQNGTIVVGGNGKGKKINQLNFPEGLDIDDDNQTMYIADFGNHRILEWKYNATTVQVVAGGNGKGNRTDQLFEPIDVTVDTKTHSLIICDQGNRRVVRWSRENLTSQQIIIPKIDCCGLAMDNHGNLYVTNSRKHEVRRWKLGDRKGTIVAGGHGNGDSLTQLSSPTFIFVDEDQSVYVSDTSNNRIMKWMKGAKAGVLVAGGQEEGDSLSELHQPERVFVDHVGNIYISDAHNNRIVCWSPGARDGTVVVGGNEDGKRLNQFALSAGLSFDRQDNLFVVDNQNHRVQKFDLDSD